MKEINRRQAFRFTPQPSDFWRIQVNQSALDHRDIIDLNATGIAFKAQADTRLTAGQHIDVRIALSPHEILDCSGTIRWTHRDQFGVQFDKLPAWMDSQITSRLQKSHLDERPNKNLIEFKPENQPVWSALEPYELMMAAALFLALTMAVWMYGRQHPEESVEVIFNRGLEKKLSASPFLPVTPTGPTDGS